MTKKLLFIVNDLAYFLSHRLPIALAAQKAGYKVHIATGKTAALFNIEGFNYHTFPLSRSGKKVFAEIRSFLAIYQLMKTIQPNVVHLVTIKPVIYGSIAARLAKVPAVVAAVAGLGYVFGDRHFMAKVLRYFITNLYRFAFNHRNLKVIFQNNDDQNILSQVGAVKAGQGILIRGSGVNLKQYHFLTEPPANCLIVVMASRLLRDKGVIEYVEAAKLLKTKGVNAQFCLAGQPDPGNPSSISQSQLEMWRRAQYIEYLGYCDNVAELFARSHLIVLPSAYREGLPRVLIEAAACGRPIVTTDIPGCRDAIIPNQTGLLVKPGNITALAAAIATLLNNAELRKAMGAAGRKLAEQDFNIDGVVEKHLEIYAMVLKEQKTRLS